MADEKKVQNETPEKTEVEVKECWLTKMGRKRDERKLARAKKKAEMTPEERKKRNLKFGVAAAGIATVVGGFVLSKLTGHNAVEQLPEGLDEVNDGVPFELTDATDVVETVTENG